MSNRIFIKKAGGWYRAENKHLVSDIEITSIIEDVNAEFPIVSGGSGGSATYKVYTALLSQSGTDAPVATVLENTLGETPTMVRNSAGDYAGDFVTPILTLNKTYVAGFGNFFDTGNPLMPIYNGSAIVGYYTILVATNGYFMGFLFYNASMTAVDLSALIGTGTLFLPEIRVYP